MSNLSYSHPRDRTLRRRDRGPSQLGAGLRVARNKSMAPNKGNHGFRRWLVTNARTDGARKDMIERATHNRCGEIIDAYTDEDGIWPAVCEAVACLKVSWPKQDVVRLT